MRKAAQHRRIPTRVISHHPEFTNAELQQLVGDSEPHTIAPADKRTWLDLYRENAGLADLLKRTHAELTRHIRNDRALCSLADEIRHLLARVR